MIVRSESILALLLPVFAVSWVIADAVAGFVTADRQLLRPSPVVQIVGNTQTISATQTRIDRLPADYCSSDRTVEAGIAQSHLHHLPQATIQRLCHAGLNFTAGLPNI